MIESIILTALVTYTVTTLGVFNSYLNLNYSKAKVIHEYSQVEQAERVIREDAENLAREIENLTKLEIAVKPIEIFEIGERIKEKQKAVKKRKEVEQAVKGFEPPMVFYALSTSCYTSPDIMKYLEKPAFPENSLHRN